MEKLQQAFAIQASPASSPAQIKEATTWLEKFQNTSEAWQVADQLLAQPSEDGRPRAEHIFAAQTMRTKIQYDWTELPPEAQEPPEVQEPPEAQEPPDMCCRALTADCLSCTAGVTPEEYCLKRPDTAGCEEYHPPPQPCCMAMTADCLACSAGVTPYEYCLKHPGTAGCKTAPGACITECRNPQSAKCKACEEGHFQPAAGASGCMNELYGVSGERT